MAGADPGPGLTVIVVEGSHVPGSVWPAAVVVCGGWMTGCLEMGILTRVWTGSCWVAASVVAAAAAGRAPVSIRGRVLVPGPVQGWGGPWSGGVRASVPGGGFFRCAAGVPGVACLGVGGYPVTWRAAAALAFAVALWMRSAGRGGSEDEVEDVDEAEDEEEVVVLGDAHCAVMRAVAGLWAAASAASTAGRMEGMSSGCRMGVGGWGGPAATWRPGGPIPSAAGGGRRGAVVFSFRAWLGRGPAIIEAVWVGVRGGGTVRAGCIRGPGGVGLGFLG